MEAESNMAFVDGQNLHMGTAKREVDPWRVNLARFRFYLQKKYSVAEAYYFLGYVQDENQDLYTQIQKAGFILMFKKHTSAMMGTKKGNVDSDIIFLVMKKLYKKRGDSRRFCFQIRNTDRLSIRRSVPNTLTIWRIVRRKLR